MRPRGEALRRKRVISRAEYDRMAWLRDRELLGRGRCVRARMATKAVGDATVRAPFTGVIVERHVTVGEYIQPGAKIATLVELIVPARIAVPEHAMA